MLELINKSSFLFIDRLQIVLGVFFYCGLHKISTLFFPDYFIKKDRIYQYHTYTYSILHSIMISIACLFYLFDYFSYYDTSFYINLSIGYTIYDTTIILKNHKLFDWKGILLHHIAMILLLSGRESYFDEVVLGLLSEISTIFLNISWILYQSNKTENLYFKLNSVIVLISYFFTRVLNCPYVAYVSFGNYDLHPIFYFMIGFLSILNIYLFLFLLLKAYSVKTKKI